jgi:hypothetical protein
VFRCRIFPVGDEAGAKNVKSQYSKYRIYFLAFGLVKKMKSQSSKCFLAITTVFDHTVVVTVANRNPKESESFCRTRIQIIIYGFGFRIHTDSDSGYGFGFRIWIRIPDTDSDPDNV